LREAFAIPAKAVWLTDSGLVTTSDAGRLGPHLYTYHDTGSTTDLVLLEAKSADVWNVKRVVVTERVADEGIMLTFGAGTDSPITPPSYLAANGGGVLLDMGDTCVQGAAGESVYLTRTGTDTVSIQVWAFVDEGH